MNFPVRFLLPVFVTALCRAQAPATPASAPAHTHTPPASSHDGVVVLDQFVSSATPFGRNQVDLAQSTTVLNGLSLLRKQQATLGDTLAG